MSTKGIKIKENREWNTTAEARGRIQVGTVWIQRGGTEFLSFDLAPRALCLVLP